MIANSAGQVGSSQEFHDCWFLGACYNAWLEKLRFNQNPSNQSFESNWWRMQCTQQERTRHWLHMIYGQCLRYQVTIMPGIQRGNRINLKSSLGIKDICCTREWCSRPAIDIWGQPQEVNGRSRIQLNYREFYHRWVCPKMMYPSSC